MDSVRLRYFLVLFLTRFSLLISRPAHSHLTSKMRQSVMSWNMNFEFGNVDILESVLAVMDQLKDEKPALESPNEEEEIFDFQKSVRAFPSYSITYSFSANSSSNTTTKRNDQPILSSHDDQRGANLRPGALRGHCNYSTNGDDLRKNPQPKSSTKQQLSNKQHNRSPKIPTSTACSSA